MIDMKTRSEPQNVRGNPLDTRALRQGEIFLYSYAPALRYQWDTGEAMGRYLAELKEGRLIARSCRKCERVMIPPRMFCERCFRPTDDWVYVHDTGTVNTFSLCYVSWDVRRLKRPEIPAVIEIDGASAGMGILHVIGKTAAKNVHIGMRVAAVWQPASKRTGRITDIAYWAPLNRRRRNTGA